MERIRDNQVGSYLIKMQDILETDVIAFYGIMKESLIPRFFDMTKRLREQSIYKKLTIIMSSLGGDWKCLSQFKEIADLYDRINFIIPQYACSNAAIVSFLGEVIYVDSTTFFGPIDPQITNSEGDRDWISIFRLYTNNCYSYQFINSEDIKDSFILHKPPEGCRSGTFKPLVDKHTPTLMDVRENAFHFLVNHNLKNFEDKERESVRIINYLMNYDVHNTKIHWSILENLKLRIKIIPDSIIEYLQIYHSKISVYEKHYSINNDIPNCLIHSKESFNYLE